MNKKLSIASLLVLAALQLFVVISMIQSKNKVLEEGELFKFKTQAIDPYDPFVGKYITLNFEEDEIVFPHHTRDWKRGDGVYLTLGRSPDGIAYIANATREKPENSNYLEARVRYYYKSQRKLTINFPFSRFYLEESKAKPAEQVYLESNMKEEFETYAEVYVLNGESVISDVVINNESITKWAERKRDENQKEN